MSNEYKDWLAEEEKEQQLNKGGYPVKNANYWKRQHDKLQAENEMMRKLLTTRVEAKRLDDCMAENQRLRDALKLYESDMKSALAGEKFYPAVFEINKALEGRE